MESGCQHSQRRAGSCVHFFKNFLCMLKINVITVRVCYYVYSSWSPFKSFHHGINLASIKLHTWSDTGQSKMWCVLTVPHFMPVYTPLPPHLHTHPHPHPHQYPRPHPHPLQLQRLTDTCRCQSIFTISQLIFTCVAFPLITLQVFRHN